MHWGRLDRAIQVTYQNITPYISDQSHSNTLPAEAKLNFVVGRKRTPLNSNTYYLIGSL